MAKVFPTEPVKVKSVKTKYRKIRGKIPSSKSLEILETLRECEPVSMTGQPTIVWEKAEGATITDIAGNRYIDFSSGVLITNAGHGRKEIRAAIQDALKRPLLASYRFPHVYRARLVRLLTKIAPKGLSKVFLITTGSEATETAQKLARTQGQKKGGKDKNVFVTFTTSFHGRTMGSQMAGGIPALKEWIKNKDPEIIQVPHPGHFRQKDKSFRVFLETLEAHHVEPKNVAGVMFETYGGGIGAFLPKDYAVELREFCTKHDIVLICDEVQAAFGRTGTFWGFEHYGKNWTPDLFCCGKGISSSLPIACVIGRPEIMDLYGPNEMTSTHTGSPLCCAAAEANIRIILKEKLHHRAAKLEKTLFVRLGKIMEKFPDNLAAIDGAGLIAAVQFVKPGTEDADSELAFNIVKRCVESGLMLFGPVGPGGGTVKINPPLSIPKDALLEGLEVFAEAVEIEHERLYGKTKTTLESN